MSVAEIFEVLKKNSMSIGLSDGKLKVADPHQKLTPALREQITHQKAELIRILGKRDSFVVSDFPCATMSEADFQEIKSAYPDLQDLYVATSLQKGMFYHETFNGREACYSRQIFFDMTGKIDTAALQKAWQAVIERHEIFRTCFVGFGANEIHQLVDKRSSIEVLLIDQQAQSAQEQESFVHDLQVQERNQPFEYGKPGLMRIKLIKLSDQLHHFLCTYHHALLDGWSLPLLLDEVNLCYQALTNGREITLLEPVPYSRYISWLSQQDENLAQTYWTDYLAGYAAPKRLHFPSEPGSVSAFGGSRVQISPALGAQLVAYCAKMHCTMNAVLHLAWSNVLARFLNIDDVVVGSASSIRPADVPNVEKMLGLLINTVPIRVRFDADVTIAQSLEDLGRHAAESADYRYFALDKMQSALGFTSKIPLFESMVAFQNYPDYGKADGDELTKNVVLANAGYSEDNNFAVTLTGSLVGERLELEIAHDERITRQLVLALADHLRTTLERLVVTAPETRLLDLDGPQQSWTAAAAPRRLDQLGSIAALVDAQAKMYPRKNALTYDFESLNYQQLVDRANKLGNYLANTGVRQNDVVAIMLDRSLDMVVTMLGVAKAGAAYLLIDSSEPDDRIEHKLSVSNAKFILADEQCEERFDDVAARKIILDAAKVAKEISRSAMDTPSPVAGPDSGGPAIAYVHFVSSPSGYPDKVAVSQEALATMIGWQQTRGIKQDNKQVLCASPVLLERCSLEVFATLCEGAEILLVNDVLDLCIHDDLLPTTISVTAEDVDRLKARGYGFGGVRGVTLYETKPDPAHLKRMIDKAGVEVVDVVLSYPETALIAGVSRVTADNIDTPLRFEPIGDHVPVHVLDGFGRVQPAGAPGELGIGASNAVFASGDTARIDAEGRIELLRKSVEHFDVAGYRAQFKEVENHVLQIDMIEECAVMTRDDDGHGVRLVAYLIREDRFTGSCNNYEDDQAYFDEVHRCKRDLLSRLPAQLVPEIYVFVEQFPRLADGSVDKDALPSPVEVSNERRQFVTPKNEIEAALVVLWEGSFLLNDISCTDDYFELGGSSLLQVRLAARINKDFGVNIPLSDLFRDATSIISQAEVVRAAVAAK